jgi:adenylate kinase
MTGISGSGRKELMMRVKENKDGLSLNAFDFGNMMYELAKELNFTIKEEKILDLSPISLRYLRSAVFEKIIADSHKKTTIVATHASFRWRKHLTSALDFHYLHLLNPDIYVNVIDSLPRVLRRLGESPQWRSKLNSKEILIWRDEEFLLTKSLAEYQRKKFYTIPFSITPSSFLKLITGMRRYKTYLSYPITYVNKAAKNMEEKDEFRKKLEDAGYIVFDPGWIDDESGLSDDDKIACNQDIYEQTVMRDYQLIDQSDFITVYYYEPVMSPGVLSELIYAFTNNKDVFVIFRGQQSPFMVYYSTNIFKDEDEFFENLKATYPC